MSKERALLRRVKVLLECSNMEPLQRQTDLIVGEIKELLAQPEEEGVYQKLLRIEDDIEVEILPSELWLDGYEAGKRSMQPEQEPISDDYTKLKEDYKYYISQKSQKREPLSDVNILCLNLVFVAIVLWFC